ncbi:MAG: hypothetical protein K8R88_06320 [Armatimonadetes bacterium]|nr:hypothetical protein [Armatimonadota bacterium]
MAVAVSGDVQVGDATFDNNNHAYLWKGTAASAVDLHPASYISSRAMAVSGDTQVGFAQPSTSGSHAGLWKGTAASWVDLNPVGAVASFARGVQGMTQVGEVNFDKLTRHAGLWTGTAQSFLDLHPIGAFASGAMGVFGSYQVGFVRYGSTISAALWKGTVASLSNLGALLPENFTSSNANFITADAEKMYIYGTAFDGVSKKRLPVVWTKAVE